LNTTSKFPSTTYLLHSNGEIKKWHKTAEGVNLQIHAHTPVELSIASPSRNCYIKWKDGTLNAQHQHQGWRFIFPVANPGNVSLVCN